MEKRVLAYEIVNRLEAAENKELLFHLGSLVTLRERKKGQIHKIFKDSWFVLPVDHENFFDALGDYCMVASIISLAVFPSNK